MTTKTFKSIENRKHITINKEVWKLLMDYRLKTGVSIFHLASSILEDAIKAKLLKNPE